MAMRLLVVLLAAGLGFGAGMIWSGQGSAPQTPAEATQRQLRSPPPTPPPEAPRRPSVDRPAPLAAPSKTAPVRSLADISAIASEFEQSAALYELAAPLPADGIVALLAQAEHDLAGQDYVGGTGILIGRLAELDYATALAYALDNGGSIRNRWLRSIFHARARLDIDEAVELAADLQQDAQRQTAGLAIINATEDLSPTERTSITDALDLPQHLVVATESDPEQAWLQASNITNSRQRLRAQMQVVATWGRSAPWEALRAVEQIDNEQMRRAMQTQVLTQIAERDPTAAIDWLDAQPATRQRDQIMSYLVSHLAERDPGRAEELMARLPQKLREQAEAQIWSQRAESDPEGAAVWLANRATREQRESATYSMLSRIHMTAPDNADRFIGALPAAEQSAAEAAYAQVLAGDDPAAAAARVERITETDDRARAAQLLVGQWVHTDPTAARRWIAKQPDALTPPLYNMLASAWSRTDPAAALDFAKGMRPGQARDQALMGVIVSGAFSVRDSAEALGRIDDSTLRKQLQEYVDTRRRSEEGNN